jgi:alkanesulfonate monooxygenase
MSIIARSGREEAVRAAYDLVSGLDPSLRDREKEREFMLKSDSVGIRETYALVENEWLKPWLWTGAVRTHGAPGIALVGGPPEIAHALIEYKRVGVTQFIFSGWPKLDEMSFFGREILPCVRKLETEPTSATQPPNRLLQSDLENSNE